MKMKTAFAIGLALLAWFALILQWLILLQVRRAAGLSLSGGVGNFFSYFTVLTNLLVALTLSLPLVWPASRAGHLLSAADFRTGVAANIALVGLTYSLLLRALWQPQGAQWLADTLLHDAVPLLYLLLWAWVVPRAVLGWSSALRWTLYPLAYLAVRAAARRLAGPLSVSVHRCRATGLCTRGLECCRRAGGVPADRGGADRVESAQAGNGGEFAMRLERWT
ncbi:conserved hypothetical protein, membrane [mine drainage metagenome]|uniref:Integral membrane protein n=1 Tax=mine drainage metagenome TaxID=410659 RepID=T1BL22_9ZZZZ